MTYSVKLCRIADKNGNKPDVPQKATENSAAFDLKYFGTDDIVIPAGKRSLLPTGIKAALPNGTAAFIYPRSGLAIKCGITLSNCVGVIDSDYRGEIKVGVVNLSDEDYTVHPNDRIAQMIITPVPDVAFEDCDCLDQTARADGGFGSTGK